MSLKWPVSNVMLLCVVTLGVANVHSFKFNRVKRAVNCRHLESSRKRRKRADWLIEKIAMQPTTEWSNLSRNVSKTEDSSTFLVSRNGTIIGCKIGYDT